MNDFDFSGYEDIINQNFYKDDFEHFSFDYERSDENGNKIQLFPSKEEYFFEPDSDVDSDSLDFL